MAIWNIKERNELVRSNEFIDVAPVCLWGGGATPSTINVIDQVNPVSTGNATDFGDLIAARQYMGGMGNKIKCIYGGGDGASNVIQSTAIFATGGNSSDFGNLTNSRLGVTAVGNDTRIIFAGGDSAPTYYNTMDQVNYATTGDATDFGDLQAGESFVGGASSTTRGVITGGNAGGDAPAATGPEATTHLITLTTLGNATDFGEMNTAKNQNTACSNNVKGVVTNGQATLGNGSYEQFNIATTGSFSDFGQLTAGRFFERGAGSQVAQRGLFGGGANPSNVNVIDFCSFTSGSSFSDFGDLSAAKKSAEGLSNNAGGIGGSYPDLIQRLSAIYMPGSGRGFAVNGGGASLRTINQMIHIATAGMASNFGDSTTARQDSGGGGNHVRGISAGGATPSRSDVVDYFDPASRNNHADFGDLSATRGNLGGYSNETRLLFGGGNDGPGDVVDIIEYYTIATLGNATDFGNLTTARANAPGFNSSTRGITSGGSTPDASNIMDYITIASTGNATDFGDLTAARYAQEAGASSTVRGLTMGGNGYSNVIDYVTIASTGDAQDFGDLQAAVGKSGAVNNGTRAVRMAGQGPSNPQDDMDFVTIASTGNAADFGDVGLAVKLHATISDSHGGL